MHISFIQIWETTSGMQIIDSCYRHVAHVIIYFPSNVVAAQRPSLVHFSPGGGRKYTSFLKLLFTPSYCRPTIYTILVNLVESHFVEFHFRII